MEIQLKWVLTVHILYFGLTTVQPLNQMADQAFTRKVGEKSQVRGYFHNLFNSVTINDVNNNNVYHQELKNEVARERQTFDTMKEELQMAQIRNSHKKYLYEHVNAIKRRNVMEKDRFAVLRQQVIGSEAFQSANPFNKTRWEPPMPKQEDLLNETYHLGMEKCLTMWFRQREHINWVYRYMGNITDHMGKKVEIQPFNRYLKKVADFINDECLVIQDIIWGERKEVRNPLDKTMLRKLSQHLKTLQEYIDEKYLPDDIKNANECVKNDLDTIRNYFKRGLEDTVTDYAKIGQMMDHVESGNYGKVKALKWNQIAS